jgi:tetratricopeptide (TPR) repeat protein
MRVHVKLLIPLITLLFCFSSLNLPVKAGNIDDAITAYSMQDYNKALTLLKQEIKDKPDNAEAYKWLGKTYEAMFDIDKAMQAYKTYEDMKKNMYTRASVTPVPQTDKGKTPEPLKSMAPVLRTPAPFKSPVVKRSSIPVKPSSVPTLPTPKTNNQVAVKTPKPIVKPPAPTPSPKALETRSDGWKLINVINIVKEKKIKLIPRDSMDLEEVDDYAGSNREFVLVECQIKYDKDIIIKSNSSQIAIVDQNDRTYYLYAMSTFKFKYGGNAASKKMEALQAADYYQLSLKDSRPTIILVFKVEDNTNLKELKIQGYKILDLASFKA